MCVYSDLPFGREPCWGAATALWTLADSSRMRLVVAASPRASFAWSSMSASTMARQSWSTSTLPLEAPALSSCTQSMTHMRLCFWMHEVGAA